MQTAKIMRDIALSTGDQKERIALYKELLQKLLSADKTNAEDISTFVQEMLQESVPLLVSRQILLQMANGLKDLSPDLHLEVGERALQQIQPRLVSFEESCTMIRESLAEIYQAREEWVLAARSLAGIPLDSGVRVLENEYKVCFARILDYKRKFLEAAPRYYGLSHDLDESEANMALTYAIICAVLAPAGPRRSQVLATLYKDERVNSLAGLSTILKKMYLGGILEKSEVAEFATFCKPHQLATLADKSTVLDRAVVEHNLLASSKLYSNISFAELGNLLHIETGEAERMATRMIVEDRLNASVDQVQGVIHFSSAPVTDINLNLIQDEKKDKKDEKEKELLKWDGRIESICSAVVKVSDCILKKYPEFREGKGVMDIS